MADTKLSALTTTASLTGTDKLYKVDGTPTSQAITATNLIHGLLTLSPSTSRTDLGLGTLATQNANGVAITGGSISGITDLPVADGGTGASTASTARTNLGVANSNPGYRSGKFYGHYLANATSAGAAVTANQLYAIPLYIAQSQAFTKLGVFVTTGINPSNFRIGIYNEASGVPGSLLLDAGAVNITSATGQAWEATISQTLNPGFYFLAIVCDSAITIRVVNAATRDFTLGANAANTNGATQYTQTFTYAALPDPFGAVTDDTTQTPLNIYLKV